MMSFTIMSMVFFAAFLHAIWNFLVKSNEDKYVGMTAIVLGHAPSALIALIVSPYPDISSIPYLFLGVLFHFGYQVFLLNSYRIGDLTQVYPLARGSAPMIIAVISVFILDINFSWAELTAVFIIGISIINLSFLRNTGGRRNRKAAVFALITGVFIASYSMIDGYGARQAGTAFGFFGWLSVLNTGCFSLFIRIRHPGTLTKVVKLNWRFTILGGGTSFFAYAIVTFAFTKAPIAIVTALRETSIIFALFLGVFFLKERLDLIKVLATIFTLIGVVLLRLS